MELPQFHTAKGASDGADTVGLVGVSAERAAGERLVCGAEGLVHGEIPRTGLYRGDRERRMSDTAEPFQVSLQPIEGNAGAGSGDVK